MLLLTDLPFELWSEIARNVGSKKDLCQLRCVNSTFSILATPVLFRDIEVRNNDESADGFYSLVYASHLAQHVRSIVYIEKQASEKLNTVKSYDSSYCRKWVWMLLKLAFSNLHLFPSLKKLTLYFDVFYHSVPFDISGHPSYNVVREIGNSHQWDILYSIGNNKNPLPELRSFKIHGWHCSAQFSSLLNDDPIAWLVGSLRHLDFSLPFVRPEDDVPRELLWKQVAMRRLLQPAVNLESLKITRSQTWDKQCLDISQAQLATYPQLTVLSLRGIVWEDGKIGPLGIIMPPPLEDFIMRHGNTLKKLRIDRCSIIVGGKLKQPVCYWADIYKRLAEGMTELVEVEVGSLIGPYQSPYVYLAGDSYHPLEKLGRREQDRVALGEFKAVVKKRRTGGGSGVRP